MSVDDQLFKQDGTLLTGLDIAALKLSRFIAGCIFSSPDDETYDGAIKRMLRAASVMSLASMFPIWQSIGFLFAFGGLFFGAYAALFSLVSEAVIKCQSIGTNIDRRNKQSDLFLLSIPVLMVLANCAVVIVTKGHYAFALGQIIGDIAFFLFMLATSYVPRLGAKPPKRRRVKVLRTALSSG